MNNVKENLGNLRNGRSWFWEILGGFDRLFLTNQSPKWVIISFSTYQNGAAH